MRELPGGFELVRCRTSNRSSFMGRFFRKYSAAFTPMFSYLVFYFYLCVHKIQLATAELPAIFATLTYFILTVMERTNKTKFIKVRVTEEEKRFILERANSAGVTLSVFARNLLLSETLRSKTDVQMVFQMKKIGTNLNQIAHYINMLPFDENVISSLSDINKLVDDINVIAKKLL